MLPTSRGIEPVRLFAANTLQENRNQKEPTTNGIGLQDVEVCEVADL
jgi:hypothetical protein